MKSTAVKRALVVSRQVIASRQIAALLKRHGWYADIMACQVTPAKVEQINPSLLVADIDDPHLQGILLLQYLRRLNPFAFTAALSSQDEAPAIAIAQQAGVDGFLFLKCTGKSLDAERGLSPMLHGRTESPARLRQARPCAPHPLFSMAAPTHAY